VRIPAAHIELNETHAAFRQPPGEQAVGGECAGLADFRSVEIERVFILVREIGQLRHGHLHAVGHLVLGDARSHFGVEAAAHLAFVQFADQIEHVPAIFPSDTLRIVEIEHRVTGAAQFAPLMLAGQKAAAPEAGGEGLGAAEAL
jgi:hypothetical protein